MTGHPIVVLAGGLSHERDVSLRSGRRTAEALRSAGLDVAERDVDSGLLAALLADPPTCVVPMLHGESGEDGAIREVLDLLGVPYVGSGPAACRTAFDKPVAKSVVARVGITTPQGVCLPHETFRELGAAQVMDAVIARLGLPIVVKPARSGSALGCTLVESAADLPDAMVNAFAYGSVALIETYVAGTEVSVPVVDDGSGPRALPAVAIRPDGPIYDYTARYTAGSTEFTVPAGLPAERAGRVRARGRRGPRGPRPAGPVALRPDRRATTARSASSRSTSRPGSPRPRWSRCRSRPPVSTWATCSPRWSGPRRRATPGPHRHERAHVLRHHPARQARLPGARPEDHPHRARARAADRRRPGRGQPHRLRRLRLRRDPHRQDGPPAAVHGQAGALRPPADPARS